ncbi:MAG: hypothetical protein ACJA13_000879 [Paraglaciecola sp.]|jgi:hypothetical protein
MKIAIMQPYLFPYIGYFQLINYADKWVVFDDVQFISKGWINRNRILHPEPEKEWQYITVPLEKHSRESKIIDVKINNHLRWKDEFLGKLTSYKRKAPYYSETVDFVRYCLEQPPSTLSKWVEGTLSKTCNYLNIPFDCSVFSEMAINTNSVEHAGQWALEITNGMGGAEYVNPAGGSHIFNENEFIEKNINLRFLSSKLTPYIQRRGSFVSGLSIIDVMMWNDKNTIQEMLNDYEVKPYDALLGKGNE